MFQHFKNIDTAFRYVRLLSLAVVLANVFCMCFCIYKSYRVVEAAQNRVHILYNGKVLSAFAADRRVNLGVELRDHIRTFHEDFFTLAPDDKQIRETVSRAFYLADESAKRVYDNLKEAGYYNNLISGNINQQVTVDSVQLDVSKSPFAFTCYATEKLIRSSNTVLRRLVTQGVVSDLKVETDNNPHGFLIRNWVILENGDEAGKGRP